MARIGLAAAFAAMAAIALLAATTDAQPTTLGTRFDGYTYVSNVIGYVNMTMDYCDIQAAIARGNFTAALDIYSTGKNSFIGLARRTFYRFATFTPSAGVVEPLHDALAMGRNATWLDAAIKDSLAKSRGSLALGLIQVAALKYFLHEVDEGFTKVSLYLNDTVNNALQIDPLTGAPHNVDEAFTLWAGGRAQACATLSGWAAKLGAESQTTFAGVSYVNSAMTLALNELQASSLMGKPQPYNVTRFLIQRHITVLGLQGVLHSAYLAQAASVCKRPATVINDAKAAIAVHWTYLRPLLAARRAPAADVKKLEDAAFAISTAFQPVLTAVRALLPSLGLRVDEVGAPVPELVTAGWNCKAKLP